MDRFVTRRKRPARDPRQAPPEKRYRQATIGSLRKVTGLETVERVVRSLEEAKTSGHRADALTELESLFLSKDMLKKTGVGRVLNRLRKSEKTDRAFRVRAKGLLATWARNIDATNRRELVKEGRGLLDSTGNSLRDRMQELYFSALVSKGLGQSDEAAETEDRRGGAPEEKNVRTRVACRRFVVAVEAALHKRAGGRSGDSLEYRRSARHVLSLLRREATSLAAAVIAGELKPKALILRACSKE